MSLAATETAMGLLTDVSGQFLNLEDHDISVTPGLTATAALNMALSNDNTSKATVYNNQNDLFIFMVKDLPVLVHRVSYVSC
ncbi:MAG: hypothetical protein HRT37_09285 [Alteromonadaceae bacterium]|nr:hypothetical protein [Alteromonadaceae bacterium]